jgi:hypothetical protein
MNASAVARVSCRPGLRDIYRFPLAARGAVSQLGQNRIRFGGVSIASAIRPVR